MKRNMFLLSIVALTLISCSKDNEDLGLSEIRDGGGNKVRGRKSSRIA